MKNPVIIILIVLTTLVLNTIPNGQFASSRLTKAELPTIKDNNLKVELVHDGLELPTTMAFLGPNDILVLSKINGTVQRILNGKLLPEPLLDVNVANKNERGMLGIAVAKNTTGTYVFLYFTESTKDGNDDCPSAARCTPGTEPLGNRLYRYQLVNNKLINPKLLLNLPATPGPGHNGGAITIGPDNNIYIPIGELRKSSLQKGISSADGRGGILRVTQDGKPVDGGILGNTYPLNLYYAYGIRNSFGIDFDPVTGKLWDTENGPNKGDEINLVEPGFNGGWDKVAGMWARKGNVSSTNVSDIILNPSGLLDFGGKAKYSAPEFSWFHVVGPTAIKFFNSNKLGTQYQNDIFVGDFHKGNLYHFDLNQSRTGLALDGPLADKIANNDTELSSAIFGNFGSITDLEVGPDGYLYIVSIGEGAIFRIVPRGTSE